MFHRSNGLPQHLRLTIFFLRLAVGWLFFAHGLRAIFNPVWLAGAPPLSWQLVQNENWAEWIIFAAGTALLLGLATRFAAVLSIGLIGLAYFSRWDAVGRNVFALVNEQVIVVLCLLVLLFAGA